MTDFATPAVWSPRAIWRKTGWSQRAAIIGAYLLLYALGAVVIIIATGAISPLVAISAGVIYLLSHVFRAIRLAALTVDALNLSGRTTAAMHFATAPVALLLPFKLGEFLRFYALYKMGGRAAYAIVVLLLDRMFDSLFLVPILILLALQSDASLVLAVFTLLAASIPLAVVAIGPRLLTEVQRYVVASEGNPISLTALKRVDRARRLVIRAADVAWRQAPQMCVLSLLICLCELLFCMILVMNASALFQSALDLLGSRLVGFWANDDIGDTVRVAIALTVMAQLLLWPGMALFFLDRLQREQRLADTPNIWRGEVPR